MLVTLADARSYMLALPEARSGRRAWQVAARLVLEAADGGSIEDASLQLELAMMMDGDRDFGPAPERRKWKWPR